MPDTPRAWQPRMGEVVAVRTADGFWIRKVVVGASGRDFPCWEVAWENDPDYDPWPMEDVRPLSEHSDALTREEFLVRA